MYVVNGTCLLLSDDWVHYSVFAAVK